MIHWNLTTSTNWLYIINKKTNRFRIVFWKMSRQLVYVRVSYIQVNHSIVILLFLNVCICLRSAVAVGTGRTTEICNDIVMFREKKKSSISTMFERQFVRTTNFNHVPFILVRLPRIEPSNLRHASASFKTVLSSVECL